LGKSKFLGLATIPGYTLFDAGLYPVAIPTNNPDESFIEGEVYEIDYHVWSIVLEIETMAGYRQTVYEDLHFFEYKDWLKAMERFKHIGSRWI